VLMMAAQLDGRPGQSSKIALELDPAFRGEEDALDLRDGQAGTRYLIAYIPNATDLNHSPRALRISPLAGTACMATVR